MTQQTQQPKYKVLNEQRTQGEWYSKAALSSDFTYIRYVTTEKGIIANIRHRKELELLENLANAEYTALAVNNLHHLAEALEDMIGLWQSLSEVLPPTKNEVAFSKAKEALARIS